MDLASAQALHRRWADATPLAKFVTERARQLCPDLDVGQDRSDAGKETMAERLVVAFDHVKSRKFADRDAQTATFHDLAAGRLVSLGLRSGSRELEEIAFSLWPGAEVDWIHGEMSRGRIRFSQIRVEQPKAVTPVATNRKSKPGRPSDGDLILEAIADYAKSDPRFTAPPDVRFKAYRKYISEHEDRRVTQGYIEDKTLQKYETIFRQENK